MRASARSLRMLLIGTTAASVTFAVAPAAAIASPKASNAKAAKAVTVTGTFQHLVADGRGKQLHLQRDVVVSGSKMYDVRLPSGMHGKPGSKVTVTGTVSGSTIDATQFAAQPSSTTTNGGGKKSSPTPTPAPTTTSTANVTLATSAAHVDRVLVILATWTQRRR